MRNIYNAFFRRRKWKTEGKKEWEEIEKAKHFMFVATNENCCAAQ